MNIKRWHIAGMIFTIIFGTLDHFFYHWSGENPLVASFAAVNESTWEHLKLLAAPMIFFSIIEYFIYGKNLKGFIASRVVSILSGVAAIVIIFYGYTAITGQNYLWMDIGTFMVSVVIAWLMSYQFMKRRFFSTFRAEIIARVVIAIFIVCLIVFTKEPPHIFLFQDPVTGNYGM